MRRYLREEEARRYGPRSPRATKPDSYRAYLAERVAQAKPRCDTTNRYAEITMRTKMSALAACMPPITSAASPARIRWRQDQDLMEWLRSL